MIKNKAYTLLASALGLVSLFASCNERSGVIPAPPTLTDFHTPGVVSVRFPKETKLPTEVYNIDNIRKLIYNNNPYPYQSKFDSAYLSMAVSSESNVKITNELTKKSISWSVRDTNKIDVSGGKLLIEVSRKSYTPIVYKMRLQVYGYNPDKLTWKKVNPGLPTPSEDGHIFVVNGSTYWMTRLDGKISLYDIMDLEKGEFVQMRGIYPDGLRPKTLTLDKKSKPWVLDDKGKLFYADDNLGTWEEINTGNVLLTGLLYDISTEDDRTTVMSAIGHSTEAPGVYNTYKVSRHKIERVSQLDPTMPVNNSYMYRYETAGQLNANIIGGMDKEGNAVRTNHFTSDGLKWGQMPYSGKGFSTPMEGGLYMRLGNSIFIVGGKYEKVGIQNKMYKSLDRGLTWVELSKEQDPGQEFTPRVGVSGILKGSEKSPRFYLLGGVANGVATSEFWQGYLDTTGGIINSITE